MKRSNEASAAKYIRAHSGNLYISALTAHLLFHFGIKDLSIDMINRFLGDFKVLPLEELSFSWAYDNRRDDDFEDALQVAVALRNGCDKLITLDKKLVKNYKNLPTMKVEGLK